MKLVPSIYCEIKIWLKYYECQKEYSILWIWLKNLIKFGFDLGNEEEDGSWGEKSENAYQKYLSTGMNFGPSEILKDYNQTEILDHLNHSYSYSFDEYANLIKSLIILFKNKKVAFLISSDSKVDLRYFKKLPIYLISGFVIIWFNY